MALILESEPNNQLPNALNLGDTVRGSAASKADIDLYKVTVTASGVLTLGFSTQTSGWNYCMTMRDASGRALLDSVIGYGLGGTVSVGLATPGAYTIEVEAQVDGLTATYDLSASFASGSISNYESGEHGTLSNAQAIASGQSMIGQLGFGRGSDFFKLTADANGALCFNFKPATAKGYATFDLYVYDSAGKVLASDATGASTTIIGGLATAGESYYVEVRGKGYDSGNYTVTGYIDAIGQKTLDTQASKTGTLSTGGREYYQVELVAGKTYIFAVAGSTTSGGTLADPSLTLCDADMKTIESCDNLSVYTTSRGTTPDPQIAYTASRSGTYYLAVDGNGKSGSYTISETSLELASIVPALLSGPRWNAGSAMGTSVTLTYGFLTETADGYTGFSVMTADQKLAVKNALATYSAVANITFVETANPASAKIAFGRANLSATGAAGIASSHWEGDNTFTRSNVFIDVSKQEYTGSTFTTLVHEIGHALGLKHPGNYGGSGTGQQMPLALDNLEFTVMSYNDDAEKAAFSSTPSVLDVAAIQTLYGAKTASTAQAQTFTVSNAEQYAGTFFGASGMDTIDASDQTLDVFISLVPGTLSSIGVTEDRTAAQDNIAIAFNGSIKYAAGGKGDDTIIGNDLDNSLSGADGDDTLEGGLGSDIVDGGSGTDVAVYSGVRTNFSIKPVGTGFQITNLLRVDGTDTLTNVEMLRFTDATVSLGMRVSGTSGDDAMAGRAQLHRLDGGLGLDTVTYQGKRADYAIEKISDGINIAESAGKGGDVLSGIERIVFSDTAMAFDAGGNAGKVYRLYQAAFDRKPDLAGLGWQIRAIDQGTSLLQLSENFMNSGEFTALYGASPSNNTLVRLFYNNVLHRTPQQFETDFWVNIIDTRLQSKAEVLMNFSESPENQAQVVGSIQNGFEYVHYA